MSGHDADEGGMTLPELLICVVLMGLVSAAIAAALSLALKVPQAAQSISAAAVDRTLAVEQWSADVANASDVTLLGCPGGDCGDPPTRVSTCAIQADDALLEVSWTDPGEDGDDDVDTEMTVTYTLEYAATSDPTSLSVTLRRDEEAVTVDNGTPTETTDTSNDVLEGYCFAGEGADPPDTVLNVLNVASGVSEDSGYVANLQRVAGQFYLRDADLGSPSIVNMEAATRRECLGPSADPLDYEDPISIGSC